MAEDTSVRDSIDHLFRQHAGQMVAVLSRIFGLERIDAIEDAVQEALVTALRRWPFSGSPENPRAWLIQVAKNKLLDGIRREQRFGTVPADTEIDLAAPPPDGSTLYFEREIEEDQLRMIFACCNPVISPDSQVALTLKIVGGFGVGEIARAYLSNDEAVAKLLTRAKQRLKDADVELEIPPPGNLTDRLEAVLRVLYLMFNEGYGAAGGDDLIREDLCFEAIRLCEILARHPVTRSPRIHAVAALFLFQASRLAARSGSAGELIPLEAQDRTLWDARLISRAISHFLLSAAGNDISNYHLEAEIAALYTLASSHEGIDWPRILECYDALQSRNYSPIVELNRSIVIGQIDGPDHALSELTRISGRDGIENYNLFHIARGHFLEQIGENENARAAFESALRLTRNRAVQKFIQKRIDAAR